MQESSGSLDQMRAMSISVVDDFERRNSIDRQISVGNGVSEEKKRPSLGSRSSSGDHLSVTPDNLSPIVSGKSLVAIQSRGNYVRHTEYQTTVDTYFLMVQIRPRFCIFRFNPDQFYPG